MDTRMFTDIAEKTIGVAINIELAYKVISSVDVGFSLLSKYLPIMGLTG